MKSFIIAFCVVACAYALTPVDESAAEVLRSSFENSPDGEFQYSYETSNGIASQVEGHVDQVSKDEAILSISGSNQFISPEGETYEISYVADQNGYQPQGAHLPTAPPVPEYILKAIKYTEEHPYVEEKQKQ